MPPEFTIEGQPADFFIPYGWTIEGLRAAPGRGLSHAHRAAARRCARSSRPPTEMTRLAAQLEHEAPRRNTGWSVTVVPIHELTVGSQARAARAVGAVLLVLLIACVNVANLLLARSTGSSAGARVCAPPSGAGAAVWCGRC